MHKLNKMLEKTGITQRWLLKRMQWESAHLAYKENICGFKNEELIEIEALFKSAAHQIQGFSFSNNLRKDIDFLSDNFGIKRVYWAACLKMHVNNFQAVMRRKSGITESELKALDKGKDKIVTELNKFKFKKSTRKAA